MVFNDTSTNLGICQEIDALCDSDTTSYPISAKVRRVNQADEEMVGKLIGLNQYWQFDDSNYTSLPIGTTTLVQDQKDYSFDVAFLAIERVEVKDSAGNWHLLKPIDKSQIHYALDEFYPDSGLPEYYDKQGESIFLYPAPSSSQVTLASGLRVYFQRTASLFTASDTTKQPGFASPFHMVLAYRASIPFCMTYKKDRVALLEKKADELEAACLEFYSRREKDIRKVMTMKPISFR